MRFTFILHATKAIPLALLALAALANDKGTSAHAYNIRTGEMLEARFTGKYSGHDQIFLENEHHHLKGEWSVVQPGDYAWGNVFATVGTQAARGSGYVERRSMMLRGRASISGDGVYLRCEFVSSGLRGHGHGACQDNQGDAYDLIF